MDNLDYEKSVGLSANGGRHSYRTKAKEKLHHFRHPDGHRVHVASSPEHAIQLRKHLEKTPSEPWEVHIRGSPEHLDALRAARSHHEGREQLLREQHGKVYDQIHSVRSELDSLALELERVTSQGVSLNAHFSRFGYDARIKSYDGDELPPHSTTSPARDRGVKDEQGYAVPLKLFKTPVVRQYFHKGILWRASGSEEVQSFELFVDLLYVGIIAINGDFASEDPTGLSLLHFVITFTLSWKIWNDVALLISWFETDDIFQRCSILLLLSCLFGYTTNITESFEHTYVTLVGFYIAARLFMVAYLAMVAVIVPMVRGTMILYATFGLVGVVLWIGSIHTGWPGQLALIWPALLVDLCGPASLILVNWLSWLAGKRAAAKIQKVFEFYPALNIEHRTERTGAFVTLVLGYTVVAILYQSAKNGVDAFFGKGVLGLVQAFLFNMIYFDIDGSNLSTHAIRRAKISSIAWGMAHLPFIMAFVLGGGALARLVVAHDCPDTDLADLTPAYAEHSEMEIAPGIRWFYCAGFGIALICMGLISASHRHKDVAGLRLKKRYRLAVRFAVGIAITCLGAAGHLTSVQLVGTVTGLVAFVVVCELWGISCCGEKLFQRSEKCQYVGRCGKKQLRALANGERDFSSETLVEEEDREGGLAMAPMS